MIVELAYGERGLPVDFPAGTEVIQPVSSPGLRDERAAFLEALEQPIGSAPLLSRIKDADRICIIFSDITRATPNERIIPWLLQHLSHVPRENITLLNGTGTHRPNTRSELERMLTGEVVSSYRVVNHNSEDGEQLVAVGALRDGTPALVNRACAEADLRIVTGFIEPHFFAGFSGGIKGVVPAVAGMETIMSNHGSRNLCSPKATFGVTVGNPLWEELREAALAVGPSFLLNVTLNDQREITGVFAGDLVEAHRVGCEFVRASAMRQCDAPFDAVVTTNSGYPLDLNLYQGVKGMSAGARILKAGGTLILACECREGVPEGSSYDLILKAARNPADLLARLESLNRTLPEQWQAQIQARIQRDANVLLHSSLSDDVVHAMHLTPCPDIAAAIQQVLAKDPDARIAVLPQGPLTIPYLTSH